MTSISNVNVKHFSIEISKAPIYPPQQDLDQRLTTMRAFGSVSQATRQTIEMDPLLATAHCWQAPFFLQTYDAQVIIGNFRTHHLFFLHRQMQNDNAPRGRFRFMRLARPAWTLENGGGIPPHPPTPSDLPQAKKKVTSRCHAIKTSDLHCQNTLLHHHGSIHI